MRWRIVIGSIAWLASTAGCAHIGGTAAPTPVTEPAKAKFEVKTNRAEPIPPKALAAQPLPRILKGKIEANLYTAQDGSFSVTVPHDSASSEFQLMQVKEQYHELGAYVSFGPAALDQSIYRVETYRRINPEASTIKFDAAAAAIVGNYKSQLETAYGAQAKEQERGEIRLNGLRTLYWYFVQQLAPGASPQGRNTGDRLSHWVYVIDGAKGAALLWVEIASSCACTTGWSQETKTIYQGVDRFVKSFQFAP
ncbi:MAG: hypothetical protein ACREUQ_05245 [Burkholderiales bacterium]